MTSPLINVDFKKATPASNILKILIKACIIPLKINRAEKTTSVTFRLRSKQILIFWLYQLIIYGTALFMMFYMTGIKPIMTWFITKFYNSNFIDFVSLMCIMTMGSIIPNLGLPFSRHLTYVANDIFLSPNLQLPNHWKKFVLSLLFYVTSVQSFTYIHVTNSKIDDDKDIRELR